VRRTALLLAALLALSLPAAGVVDAKPRGKQHRKLRGKVARARHAALGSVARVTWPGRTPVPGPSAPAPPGTPPPPDDDPPPPPPPPLPTGSASTLQVRTDDSDLEHLKLILSRTSVKTGNVKVEFNNGTAQDPHNLVLEPVDAAGEPQVFGELEKGEVATKTVTLGTGSWKVYCALLDHEAKGMTATLTVAP
jgi:plastocyanin